ARSPGGLWAHSDPLLNKPFYPNETPPEGVHQAEGHEEGERERGEEVGATAEAASTLATGATGSRATGVTGSYAGASRSYG
ncbi:unnamed protein product, partial [Closterium sp. NIES-54]